MSRVKQKNTAPEMAVRHLLSSLGYRYRLHAKELPGSPDIVLPRKQKSIFVHGCFWHYHKCHSSHVPTSRRKYWLSKLKRNRKRDTTNLTDLMNLGWSVLVVWECELQDIPKLKTKIECFLNK
jgi:DNA mismatch endonuclease (patch repair protein)